MDQREAINIAFTYANIVSQKYNVTRVILFGSFAKGNFHPDSDIDIALVLDDFADLLDTQNELMRLRSGIDSRIEPHPFRKQDFEPSNPLVYEILTHGKDIMPSMTQFR